MFTLRDIFKAFETVDEASREIKYPKAICKYPHFQVLGLAPLFTDIDIFKKICRLIPVVFEIVIAIYL